MLLASSLNLLSTALLSSPCFPTGSDETVHILAIADLGFCEEDGSMTRPVAYPNAVAVEPIGTDEEVRIQV